MYSYPACDISLIHCFQLICDGLLGLEMPQESGPVPILIAIKNSFNFDNPIRSGIFHVYFEVKAPSTGITVPVSEFGDWVHNQRIV